MCLLLRITGQVSSARAPDSTNSSNNFLEDIYKCYLLTKFKYLFKILNVLFCDIPIIMNGCSPLFIMESDITWLYCKGKKEKKNKLKIRTKYTV